MKNYWLDKIKAEDEFSWKYNTEVNNSVDVFSDIGVYNVKTAIKTECREYLAKLLVELNSIIIESNN